VSVSIASEPLERFRFTYRHLKIVRGGIFLRKMPLVIEHSVKSRIETAVAATKGHNRTAGAATGMPGAPSPRAIRCGRQILELLSHPDG